MFHPHNHAQWQTWAAAGSCALLVAATATVAATVSRRPLVSVGTRVAAAVTRRRPVWGVVVFTLSLAVSLAVTERAGIPQPIVQDEFSYLLAADTFAHGRLTNPTPPGADALQSPHELPRPTYMSKYPPGQGLALAAGQAATGWPIAGVWVTTALAAAAVYWAALAFAPPAWALVAGAVAALHPQLVDWSHVYWGGGVADLGGALVLGAAARVRRDGAGRWGLVLGVGLAVLAVSRPYEGLAWVLPLPFAIRPHLRRVALPLAAVLVPTAAFTLYDDARVTGHALRPPIVEYAQQFDVYPKVWFLPRRAVPPAYPNELMAAVHLGFERGEYAALRTPGGLARITLRRAWELAWGYANPWVLLVPLAVAAFDRRARWVWAGLGTLLLALCLETFFLPHYAAPATAAVLVLVMLGWRAVWHRWPAAGMGIGVAFMAAAVVSAATVGVDTARAGRADVLAALGAGRHLVFVGYDPGHLSADEWVYNDADPPAERVVWAHTAGPDADARLLRLYPHRHPWRLTVGASDLRLKPYAVAR